MQARRARFDDGRWHFQHGPIDLVIGGDAAPGAQAVLDEAHGVAWSRFDSVLGELVAELPVLRHRVMGPCPLQGVIARRMWRACRPYACHPYSLFITPMAAVAGAVAQELIACYEREGIERAWINNGGDIALHLAPGASVRVGVYADLARFDPATPLDAGLDAGFLVDASMPVRGIATSGWRGRSFSLGIADSVTVLAATAAQADAAATVIANAVDVNDARIVRRPASEMKDDTDLGDIPVTFDVPPLPADRVHDALVRGQRRGLELQRAGLIHCALLACQGQFLRVDPPRGISVDTDIAARQVGSVFA